MKKILENWNKYLKEQREFWGYNISPEQKISLTLKPITEIRVVKQARYDIDSRGELHSDKPHLHPKPDGLWYACGSGWIDHVEDEVFDMRLEEGNNYMYELNINYRRVFRMRIGGKRASGVDRLTQKYGFEFHSETGVKKQINWAKMQDDGYYGIEICPYAPPSPYTPQPFWYSTWAIASGCIWDPRAIQGYKLLATQPGTPGKGYTYSRPSRKGEPGYGTYEPIDRWPRFPSKQRMPGVNPPPGWEEDEAWGKK